MHDLRAGIRLPAHTNLVFDIAVPPAFSSKRTASFEQLIERRAKEMGSYFWRHHHRPAMDAYLPATTEAFDGRCLSR